MPIFQAIEAVAEGASIRVRLRLDSPRALAWQVLDPVSGALLSDGACSENRGSEVEVNVALPPEDGPYRVQLSPQGDRDRVVLIDASIAAGHLQIEPSRTVSLAALRRAGVVRAIPKAFMFPVRSVWLNRRLIGSMVRRDILARSRGSFGGALWTFLNPLLLMATYFFVFGVVLNTKFGADNSRTAWVLYFIAGMLPWLSFSEAVGRSPYVVIEHRNFVKKLVFPLETLPVNLVLSGLVTEVFALAIFFASLLAIRHSVPASIVWLPVLLVPQLLLAAGLCWFLSALGVFVRDLGQIIGFLLTVWFFMTPICYPESQAVPAWAAHILAWNPILILVRGYRAILLEGRAPAAGPLAGLWLAAALVAVLGHAWFHRLRRSFADVI
jgi:lipopolysaccharide transport system permease protein